MPLRLLPVPCLNCGHSQKFHVIKKYCVVKDCNCFGYDTDINIEDISRLSGL